MSEKWQMEKPSLNRMYQTFIKIGLPKEVSIAKIIHMIRFDLHPLITSLKKDGIINWYHFLIHDKRSGVPTTEDDDNYYFHIRFTLKKDVDPKDILPSHCVMTHKVHPNLRDIDRTLLKNEDIEEAWRIIGEQSEWIMRMLNIFKEDIEVPSAQVEQFLHYYSNMMLLSKWAKFRIKCPKCGITFVFLKDVYFQQE